MKRSRIVRKPDPGPPCVPGCDPDIGLWNMCRGCRAAADEPIAAPGPVRRPPKRRRPMRGKSVVQRAIEARYARERAAFLLTHRFCEIRYSGERQHRPCSEVSTQVHHVVDRGKAKWLIDDVRNFAATCEECHEVVTHIDIPWSKANGFYLPALRIPEYEILKVTAGGQVLVEVEIEDQTGFLHSVDFTRIWPEAHVVAWAAGIVSTEELRSTRPDDLVMFRNGNQGDARFANLVNGVV